MNQNFGIVVALISFAIIALASDRIGRLFTQIKLPMISGFLLVGILTGPFILGLISTEAIRHLSFLDDISLGFIAFAAGSELHLPELRSRLKSIKWVTTTNSLIIPAVGAVATFWLADLIPFMQPLSTNGRVAISLLAGAILVARSPSSAIAIVNELRARGPFTRTILGVIMVSDVVIIILFAIAVSTAHALINSSGLQFDFILLLLAELLVSFAIGYALGKFLHLVLALHIKRMLKTALILLAGYVVFLLATLFRQYSHVYLPFEFTIEPLLICMIGGFVVTNYSPYRTEFLRTLHDVGPPIYVIFFTLTGAAVRLDIFIQVWSVALIIFGVRLLAIFISSYLGGWLAGDPAQHNWLSWMTYVTQAGVALGLAREVNSEFPEWGAAFATMMISTIVLSQLLGPPLFKWAIQRVGEAHLQAPGQEFDGVRDAVIFGLEGQSVALARQLNANGWNAKIATRQPSKVEDVAATDVQFHVIPGLTVEAMHQLNLGHADAVVAMLSDDENYQIAEMVFERFGTKRVIVRLSQLESSDRFAQLGAIVVEPATAMVGLLDHFVRAPTATSLLLDREPNRHVADIQVTNPSVQGVPIRDLRLPLDVLIVSVTRDDVTLVSHGYTQIEIGDCVSVIGSSEGLEQVLRQLEA
ncbi:MAG: cation:proton antiporter [Caldilineaceae bacterium]|nr:cation:proton antiporter [Caldilineaceae bacterium]